jgi:integrase/recombinase XerD
MSSAVHQKNRGDRSWGKRAEGREPRVLRGFRRWMLRHRGIRPSTLEGYCHILVGLLAVLGEDPVRFTARAVRASVLVAVQKQATPKRVVGPLRALLRYAVARGLISPSLLDAVPTVARWRRSALPRYISSADVERVVAACEVGTPTGLRDRAILLVLSRLGLRAGELAELRFADIDWRAATIRIAGKGRREYLLPLPQEVGDGILAYLERGRPKHREEHVFLGSHSARPLSRQYVRQIVSRAIGRARVKAPVHGAHLLRHSLATHMLRSGSSLQAIGAVLRHRSIETTLEYAKVDVKLLQLVAQPWPEVQQ